MDLQDTFNLCVSLYAFLLGIIWTKKDFINVLMKIAFFAIAFVGMFLFLQSIGIVIVSQ